jgi:hypothetical protein
LLPHWLELSLQPRKRSLPRSQPLETVTLARKQRIANRAAGAGPGPASDPKSATKIQLPEGGVDDKTPIITNTDLITFNVTVTDIYGRFVSGLRQERLHYL